MMFALYLFLAANEAAEVYKAGTALVELRRPLEAIPKLQRAVELDRSNAQYWKALGVAHAAAGDYRGALEPFHQACTRSETLADACYYSGRAFYAADQYREAIPPLERALRRDALKARAEAAIAQCLEALGEYSRAERRFAAALGHKDPSLPVARLAYGRFLTRQGRAAEAVPVLEGAQTPESAGARYELAFALFQSDRVAESIGQLERLLKLDANHEAARFLLDRARRRE